MTDPVKKQAKKQLAKLTDYKQVFSTPEGQRVLLDLMDASYMLTSSFEKNPYQAAFNEGHRNLVLRILTKSKTDLRSFEKMIDDRSKEKENEFGEY